MSRWSTRALVAKHVRHRPGASVTVAWLMALLSIVAVLAPLALTAAGDAAIRERLTPLSTLTRDVITSNRGGPLGSFSRHSAGDLTQPWEPFFEGLEAVRAAQPEALRELLGDPMAFTLAPAASAETDTGGGGHEVLLTKLFSPGIDEKVRMVTGTPPAAPATHHFDPVFEPEATGGAEGAGFTELAPIDIMLSVDAAATIDVAVGDILHTAHGGMFEPLIAVPFRVSGTFEAIDETDDFWDHAQAVLAPSILIGDGGPSATVAAVLDPAAVGVMAWFLHGTSRTEAWFPLDVNAITTENAVPVLTALRDMAVTDYEVGQMRGDFQGVASVRFASEAAGPLATAIAEVRAVTAVVAVIAAGPLGVAIAVLLLGCRMLLEQRRPALRLLTARGARPLQVRGLLALQGLLVGAVPAVAGALVGVVIARAIGWGGSLPWTVLVVPALLAITPALLLALGGFRGVAAAGRADLDAAATPLARRLRLLAEGVTVALAVVATALLISRGIEVDDGEMGFDPLLVAAPLLLSLVACIVALRLYPLPLRAMLHRFRRSSGFVGFLGAARALREPVAGLAPALALIVGLSVAVSSGVLLSTVQQGVLDSARMQVGADIRLEASRFTDEQLDIIANTEGVRAIATIGEARATEIAVDGKRRLTSAFVVDQDVLNDVQGPGAKLIPAGISLHPQGAAVPVLISSAAEQIWGSASSVQLGGRPLAVAEVVTTATPLGARSNWFLIDAAVAEPLLESVPPVSIVLVAAEPGADVPAVAARLDSRLTESAAGPQTRISTTESVLADISGGAGVAGVRIALLLCIGLVALLSAVAVVMTLVLGTRARERLLALLPSLGATRRSGAALAVWEVWPAAASAVLVGSIFGAALPVLVLATVDLRPFTGSPVQPSYVADPLVLGAAVGGFLVLAALLTMAALAVSRRARATALLRTLEET